MKKIIVLFLFFITKTFAAIPTFDLNVASSDLGSAASTMTAYGTYAYGLVNAANNLSAAQSWTNKLSNTSGLLDAFCAGCNPQTISNLKFALDNLNLSLCQNFSQTLRNASVSVQNMQQLESTLSGPACTAGVSLGMTQGCVSALQMSATLAAQQANAIAVSAQTQQAAEANKKDAEKKLDNAAISSFVGF